MKKARAATGDVYKRQTLYPFINALVISFTDYNLVREPNFIGLANYTKLFHDEDFLGTLTATLKYTVITVPLQLAFALFIAYILNFKLKGINFFRTAYYLSLIHIWSRRPLSSRALTRHRSRAPEFRTVRR